MKDSIWYFIYFLKLHQQFIAWLYQTQWWVFSLLGNDVPAWQHPVSKTGQLAMQRDCMFNSSPFYVKERFIIPLWKRDSKKYHLLSDKTSKIVKFFFLIGQGTFPRGSATWLPKQRIDRSLWFIELFNDKTSALICSENTTLLEVCSVIKLEHPIPVHIEAFQTVYNLMCVIVVFLPLLITLLFSCTSLSCFSFQWGDGLKVHVTKLYK